MYAAIRPYLAVAMVLVSVALTATLFGDVSRVAATSDAALLAEYSRSAYGDVFGFGFWPTLAILTLVQFAALAIGWRVVGNRGLRLVFPALLAAFVIVGVLQYQSYERQYSLWEIGRR